MTATTATSATTRAALDTFAAGKYVQLTTYKRDGTGVDTPVSIAVAGDRCYLRTYDKAWKAKRMRNHPDVLIAPATFGGRPTGAAVRARARLLDGEEARRAARCLARRQPLLHGLLVPALHRLRRYRTLHYELTLTTDRLSSANYRRSHASQPADSNGVTCE